MSHRLLDYYSSNGEDTGCRIPEPETKEVAPLEAKGPTLTVERDAYFPFPTDFQSNKGQDK